MSHFGRNVISPLDVTAPAALSPTGILSTAQGGTGQDTSAWSGIPLLTAGVWSALARLSVYPSVVVESTTDGSIQAALDSISYGGVMLKNVVYDITTPITVASGKHLRGLGPRGSYIRNFGTGPTVQLAAGTHHASVGDLSILLQTTATQSGIYIEGTDLLETLDNSLFRLEIHNSAGIVTGQKGIWCYGTGSYSSVVFHRFLDVSLVNLELPIVMEQTEGMLLLGINIKGYGSGVSGAAISGTFHGSQIVGWLGRGTTTATTLYGIQSDGSSNRLDLIGDLGAGYLYDLTGSSNRMDGTVLGTTIYATTQTYGKNRSAIPPVIATVNLPAASADHDGQVIIEDNGTGDRNLIVYAGGQRFRIDGGAAI